MVGLEVMTVVPELDLARIRAFCKKRVPARYTDEARVETTVRGKAVTISDCRPPWHPTLTEWSRVPVAQLRYDVSAQHWTLYCADRTAGGICKPELYDTRLPEADDLAISS